jgi:hypothetical protein
MVVASISAGTPTVPGGSPNTMTVDPLSPPILPWELPMKAILAPVGGQLQLFWENWQILGAEDWVLNVLQKGYSLHFNHQIQLSPTPIGFQEPMDPVMASTKHAIIM